MRSAFAFCGVLSVLCTPGSNTGAQYLVMARRLTVSSGTTAAVIIGLVGSGLGILNLFLDLAYRKATQTSWSALWLPRRTDLPFLWSTVSTIFRTLYGTRPS